MPKNLTTEEFIQKAKSLHGDRYDYTKTVYVNMRTDVCVTCKEHGDFYVNPNKHLYRKQGCPICSNRTNYTFESFYNKLLSEQPHYLDGIDILNYEELCGIPANDFSMEKTSIRLRCKNDGYEWNSCGKRMLLGQGCRKCSGSLKITFCEFLDIVKKDSPHMLDEYTIISEYKNTRTPFIVKCNNCGYEFSAAPYRFRDGKTKCPNCKNGHIKKHNSYTIIKKIENTNWELLDDDVDDERQQLQFKCKTCGHIISTTLKSIIAQGYYCPNCDERARTHTRAYYENKIKTKFGLDDSYSFVWDDANGNNVRDKFKIVKENVEIYYGSYSNAINRKSIGFNRNSIKENIKCAINNASLKNISIISDIHKIKNIRDAVELKCNVCGHEWEISASSIIYGTFGCRQCQYDTQSLTFKGFLLKDKLELLDDADLENMDTHQLIELIAQNILPRDFQCLENTCASSEERKRGIKRLKEILLDKTKTDEDIDADIESESDSVMNSEYKSDSIEDDDSNKNGMDGYDGQNLPNILIQNLKINDKFYTASGDKCEYIVTDSLNRIWGCCLKDESFVDKLRAERVNCGKWLAYVIDTFLEEKNRVEMIEVDADYRFKYQPSLMQKLMAYRLKENPYYGNWCGTGAGKTNAFLFASRYIDARVTVCVCPNGVLSTISNAIDAIYPNSDVVIVKALDDIKTFNRDKFTYVLINYDKFHQEYSDKLIEKLVSLNKIDFICFDEVHNAKNINGIASRNLFNLRIIANEHNRDMKVLGMSATPLINNLMEVRTLLELISGESFADRIINNKCTIGNIHNAYKYLTLYGFRYVPNYEIVCDEKKITTTIEYTDKLVGSLCGYKNSDVNDIEGLMIPYKFDAIKQYIIKGRTIIYTQFIKKLVPNIKKELRKCGLTFREYTGDIESNERDFIMNEFAAHKFDVILASAPIATGVDGLQKVCDNIIIMSLPWTNAEYTQLIGRINRQGSNFKKVNIVIPQMNVRYADGSVWSWDEMRYSIIKKKRTLSDAVVDGVFASVFNLNRNKLLKGALESLSKGITDVSVVREKLKADFTVEVNPRQYNDSYLNSVHQKAMSSRSSHMHEYFNENGGEKWREYHRLRDENVKEWSEDPIDVVAEMLGSRFGVVADLGCGMNRLKDKVDGYAKWYSFDHYSDDSSVIKADIADLSDWLVDESVDCAVFCMSLWGVNYMDYIREAHRYLNVGGRMIIVEPTDKVNQSVLVGDSTKLGFDIVSVNKIDGKMYFEFEKKK